jgi:hypothetical protein
MSDDNLLKPTGAQIVSLPTPFHVQTEISDAFTQAMLALVRKHELTPTQIIAGIVRWTWDYGQRNDWGTKRLAEYSMACWQVWNQTPASFNRKADKS